MLPSILIIYMDKCFRCQHVLEIGFVEYSRFTMCALHISYCKSAKNKEKKITNVWYVLIHLTLKKFKRFVMSEHLWPIKFLQCVPSH